MKIVEKQIKDLIEAEYNPRRLTETQYKQLKDSLLRFGVVDPVLVNTNEDRKNIIIGGHQRTKVWGDLGNDTIPCVELDLTLDKEKELNVRLNKNTGEFDTEMLVEFFEEGQLLDFGFDTEELEFFTDDLDGDGTAEEDDYQEPDEVQTNIVQGDLITFEKNGKELHRLLCGDSTKKEDVERLMNGKKADMVFTDPPYNTGMTTKKQGDSTWLSHMFDDAYTDEEWQNFMSGFCKSYDLAIKDGEKALQINPNNAVGYYIIGKGHYGRGEYQKAIDKYKKSLETDPPYAPALLEKEIAERMLKETSGK